MLRFYFYLDCTCAPFCEGAAPHKYQKCFREQIKSPSSSKLYWSLCVELAQYFSFNAQFETRPVYSIFKQGKLCLYLLF